MDHSCPYDQLPSAAGQSCRCNPPSRGKVKASGGLGGAPFGIRSAGRLPGQLHLRITISFFSQDRLGFGEVMAGQLASQRSGNHAVLQAGSMMV
jgi:hypothetical protein